MFETKLGTYLNHIRGYLFLILLVVKYIMLVTHKNFYNHCGHAKMTDSKNTKKRIDSSIHFFLNKMTGMQ